MRKTLSDTDILLRSQLTDDPHGEIKVRLAEFLLALIQAFLRTGYYTPDHPESQKAKVGLYENFQRKLRWDSTKIFKVFSLKETS
jgi:hypothetical protein